MSLPDAVPPGTPLGECRAVIDVGTNSVKLLIGHVIGEAVEPILEMGIQTRLGEGFFATRRLQPDAIARTAAAVAGFRAEAIAHHPRRFRVIATSAAREAENRSELLEALLPAAGTAIEVISGQQEADLAFRGVCSDATIAQATVLVADVGGGSTELILGVAGTRRFSRSFPLGAVRLLESLVLADPPTPENLAQCRANLDAFISHHVIPAFSDLIGQTPGGPIVFVGVGGTAAVLACIHHGLERYERDRIESTRLTREMVETLNGRLWGVSLQERRKIHGLPPERADVILTGTAIYEALMRAMNLPYLRPSTRGLRFAALLDPP